MERFNLGRHRPNATTATPSHLVKNYYISSSNSFSKSSTINLKMVIMFETRLEEEILNNPALRAAFLRAWRIQKLSAIRFSSWNFHFHNSIDSFHCLSLVRKSIITFSIRSLHYKPFFKSSNNILGTQYQIVNNVDVIHQF